MLVLVCGSRDFANPFAVSLAIDLRIEALPPYTRVMHGAAPGADRMAARAAARHGFTLREFPADWTRYGKKAGIVRNLEMLDQRPDIVLAWWNGSSKGTSHTVAEAKRRGIPVEVVVAA